MEVEMQTDPNISLPPTPDDAAASGDAKACADCHTTKTPLWRGGPEGPKSLCNACGIRYRKRRRQALGLAAAAEPQDQQQKAADPQDEQKKAAAAASSSNKKGKHRQVTVELRVVGFAKDAMLKQQRRRVRRNKCMSEEERAAVLLMALSSGVIYAS